MAREVSWDIPFDPGEFGSVPLFVWCPTKALAKQFLEQYMEIGIKSWLKYWDEYKTETIYATPSEHVDWMFGNRRSIDYWSEHQPRVFDPDRAYHRVPVEVGDLL